MSEKTAIEWADSTVNFWWGCTKISAGCTSCYAAGMSKRYGHAIWGPTAPRLYIKSAIAECYRLNRKAKREGKTRIVFVNSMSDFFECHDGPVVTRDRLRLFNFEGLYRELPQGTNTSLIPTTLSDLRREAFTYTIDRCDNLRFLLLTKRPEDIRVMWAHTPWGDPFRPNVWLGCSIATQADADRNIPLLLQCRDLAPVLFVSAEPLVDRIDLTAVEKLDWVIVGSESGPRRRPMEAGWAASLKEQCDTAGVAFFMKQMEIDGKVSGDIESFPTELRARQFPKAERRLPR